MKGSQDKGWAPRMPAKPKSQVQDESIMGVRIMSWHSLACLII
jgi:hypothetical protein